MDNVIVLMSNLFCKFSVGIPKIHICIYFTMNSYSAFGRCETHQHPMLLDVFILCSYQNLEVPHISSDKVRCLLYVRL